MTGDLCHAFIRGCKYVQRFSTYETISGRILQHACIYILLLKLLLKKCKKGLPFKGVVLEFVCRPRFSNPSAINPFLPFFSHIEFDISGCNLYMERIYKLYYNVNTRCNVNRRCLIRVNKSFVLILLGSGAPVYATWLNRKKLIESGFCIEYLKEKKNYC